MTVANIQKGEFSEELKKHAICGMLNTSKNSSTRRKLSGICRRKSPMMMSTCR